MGISNPKVRPTQAAHMAKAAHPAAQFKNFAKSAAPPHQYWTD
ncbi:MAG: hypothetical protein ACKO13_04215 [Cytophagales bacterium]